MKYRFILYSMVICLLFCGCESWMAEHLGKTILDFKNNTDYKISVFSIAIPPYNYSESKLYPDTSLPCQYPMQIKKVEPFQKNNIVITSATWDEIYELYGTDTISFFIISTDLLNTINWDSIRIHYNIIQRYDIGLEDIYSLLTTMTFPPTPEMRDIKMWPPYGTYDSLGHSIELSIGQRGRRGCKYPGTKRKDRISDRHSKIQNPRRN